MFIFLPFVGPDTLPLSSCLGVSSVPGFSSLATFK
jgi:hypothetical protein